MQTADDVVLSPFQRRALQAMVTDGALPWQGRNFREQNALAALVGRGLAERDADRGYLPTADGRAAVEG